MKESAHIPVLIEEVVEGLNLKSGNTVIDATFGGGGHSRAILERIGKTGKLLSFDWDVQAIKTGKEKFKQEIENNQLFLKQASYTDIKKISYELGFFKVNAILLDLGLSTDQLADKTRGFSFQQDGKLDMRFSPDLGVTAEDIVNEWPKNSLVKVFREYGEEKHATRIADNIMATRKNKRITSSKELSELVGSRAGGRGGGKKHPATRIFQALRLAVNKELENIENVLPQASEILEKKGRLVVISFHSLEDRIIKNYFKKESKNCICPSTVWTCQCNHKATLKIINKKVIIPTETETKNNPASRSAKLRIAEKI